MDNEKLQDMQVEKLPVKEWFDDLEDKWKRVQKHYTGKDKLEPAAWEKWCHEFNANLRREIKKQLEFEKVHSDQRRIEGLLIMNAMFRMWQVQYRMATIKLGRVVGRGKLKKIKKQYDKLRKEVYKTLVGYEKLVF